MTDAEGHTEFLFRFNDRARADAGAEAARQLGYQARVLPGDGEGQLFQLRLRLGHALDIDELDRVVESTLRPLMARHPGRHDGSSTERKGQAPLK